MVDSRASLAITSRFDHSRQLHSDMLWKGVPICRHVIDRRQPWVRKAMAIRGVQLMSSTKNSEQQSTHVRIGHLAGLRWSHATMVGFGISLQQSIVLLLATLVLVITPEQASSQALSSAEDSSGSAESTTLGQMDLTYVRPMERTKVINFVFDAFGPYPIAGATLAAGVSQWTNSPPEWNRGVEGFRKRFASDFGIAGISTTTRYGLAQAFRQDTLYYRCDGNGILPRLRHAAISTLTGRQGEDGHRIFSVPALVAPYAGSIIAIYGWYPNRFGAKDAFRMGNYSLLLEVAGNISLEFFYSGPHSFLSRMHLNNAHGSPDPGPNH